MSSLKEKSVKSVVWVGSTRLLGQLISWAATVILVRILNPSDFGVMGMVMSYQAIIILIYDLALGEAAVQAEHLTEVDKNTCYWFTVLSGSVLTVMTWVISGWLAVFFRTPELKAMLRVSSLGVLALSVKEIHTVLLRRDLDFHKRSRAQLYAGITQLAVSLTLGLLKFGAWSLVLGLLANHVSHTILTMHYTRWHPGLSFDFRRLKAMFSFAGPILGSNLLWYATNNSDLVVIGRVLGSSILGLYQVGMDLSRMPCSQVVSILNEVCFPVFSKLQSDLSEMRAYYLKVCRYLSLIALPMIIGLILVADQVVYLFLTPKWNKTIPILRILCIVSLLQALIGMSNVVLKASGQVRHLFHSTLVTSITVPIMFILAAAHGVVWVACCWLIPVPALWLYLVYRVNRVLGITMKQYICNLLPSIVSTGLMACVVLLVRRFGFSSTSWQSLFTAVAFASISYLLAYMIFYRDDIKDALSLAKMTFRGSQS